MLKGEIWWAAGPFVGACGAVLRLFISQRRGARGGEEKVFVRERGVKLTSIANIQKSSFLPLRLCELRVMIFFIRA